MSAHTLFSDIPLLQTSPEAANIGQNSSRRDWKLILTTGVLVGAFLSCLALIYLAPSPSHSRSVERSSMFLKGGQKYVSRKKTDKEAGQQPKVTLMVMRNDVVNLAPQIYHSVRLELEDGSYIDRKGRSYTDLNSVVVKYTEIFSRAQSWDRLKSQKKIDLLYRTFMLLKSRYPFINRFVRLVFDDGRQNLELKFDDIQKMARQA